MGGLYREVGDIFRSPHIIIIPIRLSNVLFFLFSQHLLIKLISSLEDLCKFNTSPAAQSIFPTKKNTFIIIAALPHTFYGNSLLGQPHKPEGSTLPMY